MDKEKEEAEREWSVIQTQLVLIFLFSWCNVGFIVTGVAIMAFMGVVQPNAFAATEAGTYAIVMLMVGWQLFLMAFFYFFSFN